MIHRLTDLHQHLLWGMDDGAKTPEIMREMLRKAHRQGICRVAATPHVCPGFMPFDMGKYRDRLAEAQQYCLEQGLDVEVISGAEVQWTYQTVNALRQKSVPTLGGTDHVLLELDRYITLNQAKDAVRSLYRAGYFPIIAHAERCLFFLWKPKAALRFREETGALFQINAQTVLEPWNGLERRFVRIMLEEQGADVVATDAHGCEERPINLCAAYQALAERTDEAYARRLTCFPLDRY